MTRNLLYFSLNLSSRKWTQIQGFLYFSEEITPKLLHREYYKMLFDVSTQVPMLGEPIFLEEPVFLKTLSNSFPQIHSICSHQSQELSSATDSVKKPSGTRTSTQILTNRPCTSPTLFHLLYFRLFKIILEALNLWWKSHRDVQKKKESSISNGRDFYSQLEDREV